MATKPVMADYSGKLKELASGDVITPLNLGSGLPSATTFLRGDNTWATPAGGSGSGITRSILPIIAATTAASIANTDYVYLTTGTFTFTLPTAVGNTNRYTLKVIDAGTITLATTAGQTVDNVVPGTITFPTSLDFISNNSNWFIV